jgi:hypothetical protein
MSNATKPWSYFINHPLFVHITGGLILAFLLGLGIIFRNRIIKFLFLRKVKIKIYEPLEKNYKEKIIDDEDFTSPKLIAKIGEKDITESEEVPFGYIFIPMENQQLVKPILIANLPIASTYKEIRILFDESLRKNLFRFLSYRLAIESGETELASRIRDISLKLDDGGGEDFEIIEKIYFEEKLDGIVLNEARVRLRKTNNNPTVSDVREFSRFVRKISEIDVNLIRIGKLLDSTIYEEINKARVSSKGIVLLARGNFVEKAIKLSEELIGDIDSKTGKSYSKYTYNELGFNNPETGIWYFHSDTVPFIRIWLKTVEWKQLEHAWVRITE